MTYSEIDRLGLLEPLDPADFPPSFPAPPLLELKDHFWPNPFLEDRPDAQA